MKLYKIIYEVLGNMDTVNLDKYIHADNEEDARCKFLKLGSYHNTNDCRRVVIVSIHEAKNGTWKS